MGGLETQLFTLLCTLGWTSYLLARPPSKVVAQWIVVCLAGMTRPEGDAHDWIDRHPSPPRNGISGKALAPNKV